MHPMITMLVPLPTDEAPARALQILDATPRSLDAAMAAAAAAAAQAQRVYAAAMGARALALAQAAQHELARAEQMTAEATQPDWRGEHALSHLSWRAYQ